MCSQFVRRWRAWAHSRYLVWPRRGDPGFWKHFSWGDARLPIFGPGLFVSDRAWVRHVRVRGRSCCGRSRSSISLILIVGTALWAATTLAGCHSSANADAATTYQDIRADILHGNLNVAQKKAEKARKDFSASGSDWPMKFLLIDAETV